MTQLEPQHEAQTSTHFGPLGEATTPPCRHAVILYDQAIASTFLERVQEWVARWSQQSHGFPLQAGENLKSPEGWLSILELFQDAELARDSRVVAVGGGTVGDAVGFAAACWHRGVAWLGVPTTLLGMVDALVGGKTAINFGGVKNSVGAFHRPQEVHIDLSALEGLPAREMRSGWGEVLKSAIIGDAKLFQSFEEGKRSPDSALEPSQDTVERCVRVKEKIVKADFRESGQRRALNLGHTLAHALEGDGSLPHGEAVTIGIAFAFRVAFDLGRIPWTLVERVDGILKAWGMPGTWRPERASELLALARHDKKRSRGVLHMALPRDIGNIEVVEVPWPPIEQRLRTGP
ncbi:MAG: 3-dehydroquinate synthase family protein [Planctomycetota bacterium]